MSPARRLAVLIIAFLLLAAGAAPARAQNTNELYFPETGHWLKGEFLAFYQASKDPLFLYGYPITEPIQDPLTGYTMQYFNRARMELHPEARPENRVQLSPLGWLVYEPGEEVIFNTDTAACKRFTELNRFVCYAFLDTYNARGGLEQFGLPVSNLENHEGQFVQYFERARFEWHPELPAGSRVTLTDLGRLYFDQRVNDPALLKPILPDGKPLPITQLKARVFTARAVLAPNARQTIFVIAQDQYLRPVEQADVTLTLTYPDGRQESYPLPKTNPSGISQFELVVTGQPPDSTVRLAARVTSGELQANASAWFRIWW